MARRSRLHDKLPPVLSLLLAEGKEAQGPRLRDKGLMKDLRAQAFWSASHWDWADLKTAESGQYLITPSQAVDPLLPGLKCSAPPCRLRNTSDFGRFVALYTDGAILSDCITDALLVAEDDKVASFILKTLPLLIPLLPLVEAGLLQFGSPVHVYCKQCVLERERVPRKLAAQIFADSRTSFHLEIIKTSDETYLSVSNPFLLTTPAESLFYDFPLNHAKARTLKQVQRKDGRLRKDALKLLEPYLLEPLQDAIDTLLWQAGVASNAGATLLAGCRAESLALAARDPHSKGPQATVVRENAHKVSLPWLDRLTLREALRVREKADASLSALRRRLALAKDGAPTGLIGELQADADDVQRSLTPRRGRVFQDFGMLAAGIAIVVQGIVTNAPLAVSAGMLALAAKLRGDADAEHHAKKAAHARPGYALLEARRLIEARGGRHADEAANATTQGGR